MPTKPICTGKLPGIGAMFSPVGKESDARLVVAGSRNRQQQCEKHEKQPADPKITHKQRLLSKDSSLKL
jgi:hypothetical protein